LMKNMPSINSYVWVMRRQKIVYIIDRASGVRHGRDCDEKVTFLGHVHPLCALHIHLPPTCHCGIFGLSSGCCVCSDVTTVIECIGR
jgi:hypothetical protein